MSFIEPDTYHGSPRRCGRADHALRVIARGAVFELTGRQPRGEVFQLPGSLEWMLSTSAFAVVELDESDRGAPIVLAQRR